VNIRPAVLVDKYEIERLVHVLIPAAESKHQSGDALGLFLNSGGHRICLPVLWSFWPQPER